MTKRRLIVFGSLVAIAVALFVYFLMDLKAKNEVFVTVDNSLSVDKVRIDYGFYSISSGSDENLIKMGLDKVIFSDNTSKKFETICGENDFLLVYDNQFYTIVRHFIFNDFITGDPQPHNYKFDFKKNGKKIHVTLIIEGKDGVKLERDLVDVANANRNIWGKPIE